MVSSDTVSDDRAPERANWSTYWYDGRIYGTEIVRGLDVLTLQPSEHLSEAEIAAAAMADQGGTFNPQQQFPVSWPDHPVVARAYVDQLARSGALSSETVSELTTALDQAAARLDAQGADAQLAATLEGLASDLAVEGNAVDEERGQALAETLSGVAAALR